MIFLQCFTMEAQPSGACTLHTLPGGILEWINIFHPGETAEEGLLASHPQHGPCSGKDGEFIHSLGSWNYEPLPPSLCEVANLCVCSRYGKQDLPSVPCLGQKGFVRWIVRLMTLQC